MYICVCREQAPYDTCVCMWACMGSGVCVCVCVCVCIFCIYICKYDSITTVPFPERRFYLHFLEHSWLETCFK